MGLYIPNLKLPKSCSECIFTKEKLNFRNWCIFKPELCVDGYGFARHDECPLQEINIGIDLRHDAGGKTANAYPPYLSQVQLEPIKQYNCNQCAYLNITEEQQQHVIKRNMHNEHICLLYGERVKHETNCLKHDSFLHPCKECVKDCYRYYERRK